MRRAVVATLVALLGVLFGLLLVELGLALIGTGHTSDATAESGSRTMHYIYTKTGIGKCYPTNPLGYFPFDLTRPDDFREVSAILEDVSDLPDDWSLARQVEQIRTNSPYCAHIELVALNRGPAPLRGQQALIIGDSFAFGEGLRLSDTLGYRMAEQFLDYNFINMAWPGASVETLFDLEAAEIRPSVVLYFFNINDVRGTPELERRELRLHALNKAKPLDLAESRWSMCARSLRVCGLLSRREAEIARTRASIQYYRDIYFSTENRGNLDRAFERIGKIKKILDDRGERFVIVMFPLFYKAPFAGYPFEAIHSSVKERVERLGIEFIDLLPLFESHLLWDRLTVHPLDRHPSAQAIDEVAGYLAEHLDL